MFVQLSKGSSGSSVCRAENREIRAGKVRCVPNAGEVEGAPQVRRLFQCHLKYHVAQNDDRNGKERWDPKTDEVEGAPKIRRLRQCRLEDCGVRSGDRVGEVRWVPKTVEGAPQARRLIQGRPKDRGVQNDDRGGKVQWVPNTAEVEAALQARRLLRGLPKCRVIRGDDRATRGRTCLPVSKDGQFREQIKYIEIRRTYLKTPHGGLWNTEGVHRVRRNERTLVDDRRWC